MMKILRKLKITILAGMMVISISVCSNALPYIGEGCTTALWIDKDCDGYVIGGKDGTAVTIFPSAQVPPHFEPDANDRDTAINTPQTVTQRYGDFSNIQNFKNYLHDLGYTHQINNVYFVAVDGVNATAQPNDITKPYYQKHPEHASFSPTAIVQAGDVVVYRGGVYPGPMHTRGRQYWVAGPGTVQEGFQGTATQPVLVINYPGERVVFKGFTNSGFGFTKSTRYTIVDGFELDGEFAPGQYTREVVSFSEAPIDHVTMKNMEVRNGGRWGIFCYIMDGRDYVTLDTVVTHHIHDEHTLYHNDDDAGPETDIGWTIKNCLFYFCGRHAIHWRGGKNFLFENNIFHTTGMMGIEMKNGCEDGIVRNNLIFNTERAPISFYDTDEVQHTNTGIKNILITNNILAAKSGTNGMGGDNSSYASVMFTHDKTAWFPHQNIRMHNNILFTQGHPPVFFEEGVDVAQATIGNNIFFRNSSGPNGMRVCGWTDGTHTSGPFNQTYCPQAYYWDFNAMMNPIARPQFFNNLMGNPQFVDLQNVYTSALTPWLYNLMPTATSPNIDFADPQFSPPFGIKGTPRVGPADAGVYEYSTASSNQAPFVNSGADQAVTLPGTLQLNGNVVDDGLPNPPGQVSLQWTIMNGPGTVNFSNPNGAATDAVFSTDGVYILRLTANDGALFTSDQVQVTVSPSSSQGGGGASLETKFLPCMDLKNPDHLATPPICYQLSEDDHVELTVYSKEGQKIRTLVNDDQSAGLNTALWDRRNDKGELVGSGIYSLLLRIGDDIKKSKIAIIR